MRPSVWQSEERGETAGMSDLRSNSCSFYSDRDRGPLGVLSRKVTWGDLFCRITLAAVFKIKRKEKMAKQGDELEGPLLALFCLSNHISYYSATL